MNDDPLPQTQQQAYDEAAQLLKTYVTKGPTEEWIERVLIFVQWDKLNRISSGERKAEAA